jgi:hypothetical protein
MQGVWDGIYFPGLGWSNYTGSDATVAAVDSSNITSWNDNWCVFWKDSASTIPLMGLAFTNRSCIEKIEVNSKLSESGIYYVRPWVKEADGVTEWTGTYIYFAMQNVDPSKAAQWQSQAEDLAHMAMTERDLTYSFVSQTSSFKTYKVTATFHDASIGDWSISINKTLPTFEKQTGEIYTAYGNVSYVESGTEFTIERFRTADPDTHTLLQWGQTMVNDWASNSLWWVNQASPKVVGWREAYSSADIHIGYSAQIMKGYYDYYLLTGDDTLFSNIDLFCQYICDELIEATGKVCKEVTISTGSKSGESYIAFEALIIGYDLTGNSTFLDMAELNWNRVYSESDGLDKGWERYAVDSQMVGTLMLHQATDNTTYYHVIENITLQIIDGQARTPKLDSVGFDDHSYRIGGDVSEHSHCVRTLDYVLATYGDITSYDLNYYVEKAIEWSLRRRDSYGGQVSNEAKRYIYYPCHQTFSGSASLFYLDYLMQSEGSFNRTYFKYCLENIGWIQGNNELSYDFYDEATGRLQRAIQLLSSVPTVSSSIFAYDQGHFLELITRLSQVQNNVIQYDNGINVENGVRITSSTATLTSIVSNPGNLLMTLAHGSGTSTTKVYCADRGEPKVTGATAYSYSASTKILTFTVTHWSSQNVGLDWSYAETRRYVVDRGFIALSLVSVSMIVVVAVALLNMKIDLAVAAVLLGAGLLVAIFVVMYILAALSSI